MNDELKNIWKESVAVCFEILSRYSLGRTEENYETLSQDVGVPFHILTRRIQRVT
jgi:hypothetical protein